MKSLAKALLVLLFILVAIIVAPFLFLSRYLPNKEERRQRTRDENDETIAKAERRLGRKLPPPLREFYLSGRHRKRAPEGVWYGLDGAVAEYKEVTREPYGPGGQDWPADLFPIADLLHGYAAYDFAKGEIVEWDPEEIGYGDDESDAAWRRSFKRTGKSLAQYAGPMTAAA
jgi:hypothetical protein